jgi:hypothetical protein
VPWIVREIGRDTGEILREIDVDEALTFVFARILGERPDDMIGAVFPMDHARFDRIKELFALAAKWDDADWYVEAMAMDPTTG